MDTKNVDQNLLFALLALRMGFIDNEAMVAALNAWSVRKDESVGHVLVAQEALAEARLFLVEQTFTNLLESSGGDPHVGTVALRLPAGLVETNLERIEDPSLRAALARLEEAEVGGRQGATADLLTTEFDPQLALGGLHSSPFATQPMTVEPTPPPPLPVTELATGELPSGPATEPATGSAPPGGVGDPFETTLPMTDPIATELIPPAAGIASTIKLPATQPINGVGQEATVLLEGSMEPAPPRGERERGLGLGLGLAAPAPSRYRSLRPLAKGGLGEVFVALDEELGREVALKEIQERHLEHPESRARFLMEAEVTGGLEHPGIVPVYGLGQYPDGRPYYAMRFIRGQTLKEAIDAYHETEGRSRDPGARSLELRGLLNRIIDVCNALAYAHTRGILHRDIKPANIMLGGFGETLVVDWGLAKAVDRPEMATGTETQTQTDPGLRPLRPLSAGASGTGTMYGSTMGTPHFMSPEQAAGQLDRLGPASDIYSIGATLYFILVGKPPFLEPQMAVLLNKVRQGKFPRPREANREVPAALEAICLKAMALQPQDRYRTARALADDLEHWLADEPVLAYREPWTTRLARWAKRHKTLVTTSAALVLAALVALSIGTVLIRREQARTEVNFRLARDAVDQMLTRLGEVELADVPQMEQVRGRMLDKARTFYETFLAERGGDRSIRRETGRANLRLGDIEEMLGDYTAAEAAYDRAIALGRTLVAAQPGARDDLRDLASARHKLGVLLKKSNRFSESESALREAQDLRHRLVAARPADPDDQRDEMDSVYQLGTVLARLGRVKEVETAYAAAVDAERKLAAAHPDQRDYPRKLGRYLNNRGILLRSTSNDPRLAEAAFREALGLQQPLSEKSPTVAGLQWERARTTSNLAGTLVETQGPAQALPVYREAFDQFKRLADDYPSVPDYQNELAVVSFNLGSALIREAEKTQDKDARDQLCKEASERLDLAVATYQRLIQPDRFPHRPDFRQKLALAERKHGILLDKTGQPEKAEAAFRAAVKALRELDAHYPQVPEYQSDLGVALENLASNRFKKNEAVEARQLLDESIAHQRVALKSNPKNPYYRRFVLDAYTDLDTVFKRLGDHAGAAAAADALVGLLPEEPFASFRSAQLLDLSAALVAVAADTPEARRKAVAETRTRLAVERLQNAVRAGAKILPRDLDAPEFEAIRARFPDTLESLKKAVDARVNPKVG